MIFYWAFVYENDVENYAKSLTLPCYMSHLSMEPFRFEDQVRNTTGKELLVIRYVSDGRLEEYSLHPFDHANSMIASLDPKIDPSKIKINSEDAIWNWGIANQENGNEFDDAKKIGIEKAVLEEKSSSSIEKKAVNKRTMRIFFEPIPNLLSKVSSYSFSPQEAYVSVSRSELFISLFVIRHYLLMGCLSIQKNDQNVRPSNLTDERPTSKVSPFRHSFLKTETSLEANSNQDSNLLLSQLKLKQTNGGFCFRFGNIGGKYLVGDESVFNDLIVFAGLDRSLNYVSEFVKIDFSKGKPKLEADGLHFRLSTI
ncbi:MAG: hypothetical protein Q4C95_03245 [Planctomycetia bacterium]|nr:hypothetical protein [Planctomycetia bacterium]